MRPPFSGSLRIRRLPSVEQSSMQLGVMTPMWPPGANSRPPAVKSTYGAPAPQAKNSAASGFKLPKRRRANNGNSSNPPTPNRSAVMSHASSALPAMDSFVIAGKPAQISAANAPNNAPASGEGPEGSLIGEPLIDAPLEALQRLDRRVVVERQVLHQQHAADAACRVDPEFRVEDSGPGHTARRAREFVGVRARNLEAEPELVAAGAERKRLGQRR